MNAPKRVAERLATGMKRMRPIIEAQKDRDVSEADTVTLVKDLLAEVFGYDKYADVTSEMAIRGTFCDLAIKLGDKLTLIVEVKAIGIPLDDKHVKQAVDYAANQGVEWVALTNAQTWRMYRVIFGKPIDKHLVCEIDMLSRDWRKADDIDCLFPFSKEAVVKGVPQQLMDRKQATSRFMLASLLLNNDSVISTIRRELRRVVEVSVDCDEIVKLLRDEVIKREAMDGQPFADAVRRVNRHEKRALRAASQAAAETNGQPTPDDVPEPMAAAE